MRKDYCLGKLDPTPGCVMAFGESYQDNAIREIYDCSNAFFECIYRGSLHELVLQTAEVDACNHMSLTELYRRIQTEPDAFMPDACHALQLYFQHTWDKRVRCHLLCGYSSSGYDNYNLQSQGTIYLF